MTIKINFILARDQVKDLSFPHPGCAIPEYFKLNGFFGVFFLLFGVEEGVGLMRDGMDPDPAHSCRAHLAGKVGSTSFSRITSGRAAQPPIPDFYCSFPRAWGSLGTISLAEMPL